MKKNNLTERNERKSKQQIDVKNEKNKKIIQ